MIITNLIEFFITATPHISLHPSQGLLSIGEERAARVDVRLHTPEDPRGTAKIYLKSI